MLSRRYFVRGSAVALAGAGSLPGWLARAAETPSAKKKILVAIFQRGAADGLNIVVPFGDKRYKELRPTIGVAAPSGPPPTLPAPQANGLFNFTPGTGAIDLDGKFGLHPQMLPMKQLWDKGQLAVIHAAGSPDPSRSHFDAQDYMESGTPGRAMSDGWLNRALPAAKEGTSPLRAISVGAQLPRTMRGEKSAVAVTDQNQFQMGSDASALLEKMYATTSDKAMGRVGREAFEAMAMVKKINQQAPPFNQTIANLYAQGGELGRALQQISRMIKADAGVEAAFAEVGNWDHHVNEQGQLPNMLRQFSTAMLAFSTDMGDKMEDIALVTMSEFGRTAQENGTAGTDHGHGNVMMLLGGPIKGGKVYGPWPGLEKEQLFENRDLAVTTDFRAVLSELLTGHLGQSDLTNVFPGYKMGSPLGLLKA